MQVFYEGLLLGFAYAMPIGTQNLFVINSAINDGLPRSYLTTLSVTFMDVTLALLCFYSAGLIVEMYPSIRLALLFAGVIFLFILGTTLLRTKKNTSINSSSISNSPLKTITIAFVLTWFNPQALFDGVILLGGYYTKLGPNEANSFMFGVGSASIVWFFFVTTLFGLFRSAVNSSVMNITNRVCGVILLFLGGKMLISSIPEIQKWFL